DSIGERGIDGGAGEGIDLRELLEMGLQALLRRPLGVRCQTCSERGAQAMQRLGPQSLQRQLALGRKVVAQPAEAYTGGAGSDTHRQATHPHGKQVRRNGTIDLLLPRQAILRWAAPAAAYLIGHTASSCATYPREASHSCAR